MGLNVSFLQYMLIHQELTYFKIIEDFFLFYHKFSSSRSKTTELFEEQCCYELNFIFKCWFCI